MADIGHEETDDLLEIMTDEIYAIYEQAAYEMKIKAEDYMAWFEKTDEIKREQLKNGIITEKEYKQWKMSHLLTGDRWLDMADVLAQDMNRANLIAANIINGYQPTVYAVNINYMTYRIEHKTAINTSYTLYNAEAVEKLIREKPDILPVKAVAKIPEATRWNMNNVRGSMIQSILQGDTMEEIADRLSETVTTRNRNAALRDARTMTTCTENAGRMDAMRRVEGMGVKIEKGWLATLDGRTRHSHRLIDGEIKPVDEPFSNGCMFPADPNGEPAEIYNCRCRLLENITKQEFGKMPRDDKLEGMSYEDWQNDKGDSPLTRKARNRKNDLKQFDLYKKILKGKRGAMPREFKEFQRVKYYNPEEWKAVKKRVREARKAGK